MSRPMMVATVAVSAIAALVLLAALGVVDLSRLRSSEPSTAGLIAVPTSAGGAVGEVVCVGWAARHRARSSGEASR